eukprot:1150963-Pelagomonas_calceolata.AAC.4
MPESFEGYDPTSGAYTLEDACKLEYPLDAGGAGHTMHAIIISRLGAPTHPMQVELATPCKGSGGGEGSQPSLPSAGVHFPEGSLRPSSQALRAAQLDVIEEYGLQTQVRGNLCLVLVRCGTWPRKTQAHGHGGLQLVPPS